MANEVLQKLGTPIVWADTTDYSSTGSGFTRTHQLDLTGIANGAARQGDKADLGATRAAQYAVVCGFEIDVAPTAGTLVEVYWSSSFSGTAGTGNDGGASGADAAWKAGEEDEWKKQLIHLGSMQLTADASTVVQRAVIGFFTPPNRYGMPIVLNKAGQALEPDAVEMYVALVPIIDEIQ
jgi:hypothetical protein